MHVTQSIVLGINRIVFGGEVKRVLFEISSFIHSIPIIYNSNLVERLNEIYGSLLSECDRNSNRIIKIDEINFLNSFNQVVFTLLEFDSGMLHLQLTSVNSLVIKTTTSRGTIYVEIFFDEDTGLFNEATLNIYCNKKLQVGDFGSLEKVISLIKDYHATNNITYSEFLTPDYALSDTATATSLF